MGKFSESKNSAMVILKIKASTLAETLWALLLVVVIFSTSSVLLERYYRIGITTDELRMRNLATSEWYFLSHGSSHRITSQDTINRYLIQASMGLKNTQIELFDTKRNQTHTYEFPNE